MDVVTQDEVQLRKDRFAKRIQEGALFIHPTDTIYGLGCDATNADAVKKLRSVKSRFKRPFSVIAPSKEWVKENCEGDGDLDKWLKKLPGPYTFIVKLKKGHCLASETNNGLDTLGVRIPDHWFSDVVAHIGCPVVTTSANLSGGNYMTELEDLNPTIKGRMTFCIYEGPKQGKPSKVIDLTTPETRVLRE